ncbi:MAG: hypothetical protein OXC91_15580 [Rhodobacteraceae bacterium]|nr:hypothetical protein [Paracoccaceae bacterium]
MDWSKTILICISILALAGTVFINGNGIHSRIDTVDQIAAQDRQASLDQSAQDRQAFLNQSAQDRQAFLKFAAESLDRSARNIQTFLEQAERDRRSFETAMAEFRSEMQRLSERQSYVEGIVDVAKDSNNSS